MTPPPRRLVLMRHAKSSWDRPAEPDHERSLNRRGRLAATLMGAWFAEQPWAVDLALVSTSTRTRETWDRLMISGATVEFRRALYHAAPDTLWAAAQGAPDTAETVLIIAHNPGLEELLSALPGGPRRTPTAAIAVIEINEDWRRAGLATARLTAYEEPKSLV